MDTTPGMRDGIDSNINDIPPHVPAWNRNGDRMGPDTDQSDIAPPTGV